MAARDILRTYRIPGTCFKNPLSVDAGISATTGAFSAGLGTRLGIHDKLSFALTITRATLKSRTKGVDFDEMDTYRAGAISVFQRDMDQDVFTSIFGSSYSTLTASTEGLLTLNARESGVFLSANSFKLLLVPRDPEVFPGVLFYNAIATLEPTPVEWGLDQDWGHIVVYKALPDATNRLLQFGRLQDFTL